jgi:hypothetical protein
MTGFDSWQEWDFFFTTMSRPALWPTQPPIQREMGAGVSFLGVKWLKSEADHSSSSTAEVKNV